MKQDIALRYSISPGRPMDGISPLPPAIIQCSYGKWTPEKRQRPFPPGRFLVEEKYYAVYCIDRSFMPLFVLQNGKRCIHTCICIRPVISNPIDSCLFVL